MKLYWRYKKDGKWTWKSARTYQYSTTLGKRVTMGVDTITVLEREEE